MKTFQYYLFISILYCISINANDNELTIFSEETEPLISKYSSKFVFDSRTADKALLDLSEKVNKPCVRRINKSKKTIGLVLYTIPITFIGANSISLKIPAGYRPIKGKNTVGWTLKKFSNNFSPKPDRQKQLGWLKINYKFLCKTLYGISDSADKEFWKKHFLNMKREFSYLERDIEELDSDQKEPLEEITTLEKKVEKFYQDNLAEIKEN